MNRELTGFTEMLNLRRRRGGKSERIISARGMEEARARGASGLTVNNKPFCRPESLGTY